MSLARLLWIVAVFFFVAGCDPGPSAAECWAHTDAESCEEDGCEMTACDLDPGPSAAECATFTDKESCRSAGCDAFLSAWPAEADTSGRCTADTSSEPEYFCVNRETGIDSQALTYYYRGEGATREVYKFSSDHGPLEGWSYCGYSCDCGVE